MLVISNLAQLLSSSPNSITGQQSTTQAPGQRHAHRKSCSAEASGVAHGPGRSGLGRGRYIEVAGDRKSDKAAIASYRRCTVAQVTAIASNRSIKR